MYQQKNKPYNQMNEVYEQEQYEQQQSQPLIEQVDANYQPTQKQVRQYATDVLGMSLPEDQRLLYLARQGLKAPLPTNWQPYQSRDGEVYYKHKITQQKTFQHPTDVQYRKKYTQEKQRMARKNLKSMSLKANPLGFGQPLGHSPLGAFGAKPGMNLGLSNLSDESHQTISKQVSKIDSKLQEQLQKQIQQLQLKLKKQLKQYQSQRQIILQKNLKKYKTDFQKQIKQLKTQKSENDFYNYIKEQKQRIKERLKQAYDDRFKDQLVDIQKQQTKKYKQYQQLYEEDYKIKFKKYQNQKQDQFKKRIDKFNSQEKTFQINKKIKLQERQKIIKQLKYKLQNDNNQQIQQATNIQFEKQIRSLKQKNQNKIKQFAKKLQNQFMQIKKMLGQDQNQLLQQSMQKKNRLKRISQQKIQSLKKKQYQKISQIYNQQLQKLIKDIQSKMQNQNQKQLQKIKKQKDQKIQNLKNKISDNMNEKVKRKTQQIYSECQKNTKNYEKQMNKKILQIRNKYISQVIDKNNIKTQELNFKVKNQQKQQIIQNKQQILRSLRRQIQIQKILHQELHISKQLQTSKDIESYLKNLMQNYDIKYKPEIFLKQQKKYNQLKNKFRKDKQLLGSMMGQLQKTAIYGFYDKKMNNSNYQKTSSSSILVKQYNKDVRIMRNNQQMLSKFQLLLRKAQLNDEDSIKQLNQQLFQYEQISIKSNLGMNVSNELSLNQIQNVEEDHKVKGIYSQSYNSFSTVQNTLNQHSQFLSNVKNELNRKLYKLRNNSTYRY